MRSALLAIAASLLAGCDGEAHAAPAAARRSSIARSPRPAAKRGSRRSGRSRPARAASSSASSYQVVMQRLLPDRYRHDVEVSDATARAGDRRRPRSGRRSTTTRSRSRPRRPMSLRESWRLGQVSMLLPLQSIAGHQAPRGCRGDDGEVLRVTFPEDPKFPGDSEGALRARLRADDVAPAARSSSTR